MPNLITSSSLSQEYISAVFENDGQFDIMAPISIIPKENETIRVKVTNQGKVFVKLIDNIQFDRVCSIVLEQKVIKNRTYYLVKLANSIYPKKGYLKYIFQVLAIDYGYVLMSDNIHTIPGSMNFWKKLKLHPGTIMYVMNISSGYKRLYKNQTDDRIWGLDNDFFSGNELNSLLVESMWEGRLISKEMFEYIIEHQDTITWRKNIRLIYQKL